MEKEQVIVFVVAALAIVAIVALSFNAGIHGYAINQKIRPIVVIAGGDVVDSSTQSTVLINVDIGHFEQAMQQVDLTIYNPATRCLEYAGAIERPPFDFYIETQELVERCGTGRYTVFVVATHPSGEEVTTTGLLYLN